MLTLQAVLRAIDGLLFYFSSILYRTVMDKGQNRREEGAYKVNHPSSCAHCIAPAVVWKEPCVNHALLLSEHSLPPLQPPSTLLFLSVLISPMPSSLLLQFHELIFSLPFPHMFTPSYIILTEEALVKEYLIRIFVLFSSKSKFVLKQDMILNKICQ